MVLILLIIFVSDSHAEVLSEGTVVSQIVNKFYEQYCVERQKSENFQIPLETLKYYDIFIITYCVAPFNE